MAIVRCPIGSKPSDWSAYLDWNWDHKWPKGERATGRCLNCGFTVKELSYDESAEEAVLGLRQAAGIQDEQAPAAVVQHRP